MVVDQQGRRRQSRHRGKAGAATASVEKSTHIEDRTIDTPSGEQTISLFAQGGAVGISVLTDTGKRTFVALERVRTRNPDKGGYR
ncbi:MAG: hypothetical protein R2702_06680 [Acidimicrobiales bacterium]